MVVNLVSESCRAFAIVPFKSTKGKRTAVGEDYPPPNSLQRFLTISNVRIIYSHKGAARRNQDVLATDGVINVFPDQSPDKTRQIGVQLLLQHRRNKPPSFDLILAEGRISLSAEVFRFFYCAAVQSPLFGPDRSDVRILFAVPVAPILPAEGWKVVRHGR